MNETINLGTRPVGNCHPVYIIAEIGINHNGSLDTAKRLIDTAVIAGCDAVKFQKRTPRLCVPEDQKLKKRDTPWGYITYLEYKEKIEFGFDEYTEIDNYCKKKGIDWFASCWDVPSVEFIQQFNPLCYKIASASLTDDKLLSAIKRTGKPVILSTGMSTMDEICHSISNLGKNLILMHTTSTYPCPPEELNLRMISTLKEIFGLPVGYSGHEVGLQTTLAAVAMGACSIERHITLDRAMWGSDQSASVEPNGLWRLVRDIRIIETAMGDGVKVVYDSELASRHKLRMII